MKDFLKRFLQRHFSAALWPALLFVVSIAVLPFIFITDSREDFIELKGHLTATKGAQGYTNEKKTFEFQVREFPRRFVAEMRILDQVYLTQNEMVGSQIRFTVEKSKFNDTTLNEVPVLRIWSDQNSYLASEDFVEIMRANRSIAGIVWLASFLSAFWLARRLWLTFCREKATPPIESYDFLVLWAARNPKGATGSMLFIACILFGALLPVGLGYLAIPLCLGGYTVFHVWFAKNGAKVKWINDALEFERRTILDRPRVETTAPQHVKELSPLLKEGADINAVDGAGQTALHRSTAKGSPEAVDFLLRHGANPDIADAKGQTALMIAAGIGHMGIVMKLVEKGATPLHVDTSGATALTIAQARPRNDAVISYLKKAVAKAEAKAAKETADKIIAQLEGTPSAGKKPPDDQGR